MSRRKGFTLIELLVVISIIALLVSVLMPALNKAKKSAYAAICKHNLHEWGLIWKFYVKEEGGRNPYRAWWDIEDQEEWEEDYDVDWQVKGSYVINLWSSDETGSGKVEDDRELFWRTPYAKHVSYAPIMMCAQWKDADPLPSDDPPEHPFDDWQAGDNEMKRACLQRHGDFVNGLFMDWSVRRIGLKELWELWWHRGWPEDRPLAGEPDWATEAPWMLPMKSYAP